MSLAPHAGTRSAVTVVVSGLPRAGTSMAMQMVVACGVPAFDDGHRPPDESNPRGYLEHAAVRQIRRAPEALAAARGHAVKVVSPLLPHLPPAIAGERYRVVFVRRDLREVLDSQRRMLEALGEFAQDGEGASAPSEDALGAALEKADVRARRVAEERADIDWIEFDHAAAIAEPRLTAERLATFVLGRAPKPETVDRVAAVVDPQLHRARPGRRDRA